MNMSVPNEIEQLLGDELVKMRRNIMKQVDIQDEATRQHVDNQIDLCRDAMQDIIENEVLIALYNLTEGKFSWDSKKEQMAEYAARKKDWQRYRGQKVA